MHRVRAFVPEFALLAVLAAAPLLLPPLGFSHDLLSRVLNWALFGLGLDILFGLAGLLSFGQAAFYGIFELSLVDHRRDHHHS